MNDLELYRKNGFLLLKKFFPSQKIDRLRSEAKEIFLLQLMKSKLVKTADIPENEFEAALYELFNVDHQLIVNCGKHIQHLISLHQLSLDATLINKIKELGLDFPNICTRPVLYFNTPRLAKKEVYNKLTPHQDWRSMQGSLDSIIAWAPLVDIDVSLGALEIVPGSHKVGLLPSGLVDGYGKLTDESYRDFHFEPVEVERGDVLLFSSFLVHRSGDNITEHIRWSCHFRYNNMNEPSFIGRGFPHPYIYKPQEELITPDFPAPELVNKTFN